MAYAGRGPFHGSRRSTRRDRCAGRPHGLAVEPFAPNVDFRSSRHAHPFRHPTQRRPAHRQLFWHDAAGHRASGRGRGALFHRRLPCPNESARSAALREHTRRVALDFLACGLDPERAALFRQSDVPQVTELAWILSTVTPMGLLERAHSYKDKVARGLPASSRALCLSGADGGRYFDLRQRRRAGRARPKAASRIDARHRDQDERDLRRNPEAARTADPCRDGNGARVSTARR